MAALPSPMAARTGQGVGKAERGDGEEGALGDDEGGEAALDGEVEAGEGGDGGHRVCELLYEFAYLVIHIFEAQ